jgi:hypothetical protein
MPRKHKLSDAAVRKIYTSKVSAKDLSVRYDVSPNTIYLIRQGRRRQDVTRTLPAAKVSRREKVSRGPEGKADIDALADALFDRIVARLRNV